MRFIDMWGFTVRPDKQIAFQQWVTENLERIKASYPEGSEFGGVYAAIYTTDKEGGSYYWLDICDSYAALDRGAAVGKDANSEAYKVNAEFIEFLDPDRHAPWSKHLLKSVVDLTVMDMPVE